MLVIYKVIILFHFVLSAKPIDRSRESSISNMNKENTYRITALLRASREQDEAILKNVFGSMANTKYSEEDLNAVDCSGRVSTISIILSRSLRFCSKILIDPN